MATITLDNNDPYEIEYPYCVVESGNGSKIIFIICYYDSDLNLQRDNILVSTTLCKLEGFESISFHPNVFTQNNQGRMTIIDCRKVLINGNTNETISNFIPKIQVSDGFDSNIVFWGKVPLSPLPNIDQKCKIHLLYTDNSDKNFKAKLDHYESVYIEKLEGGEVHYLTFDSEYFFATSFGSIMEYPVVKKSISWIGAETYDPYLAIWDNSPIASQDKDEIFHHYIKGMKLLRKIYLDFPKVECLNNSNKMQFNKWLKQSFSFNIKYSEISSQKYLIDLENELTGSKNRYREASKVNYVRQRLQLDKEKIGFGWILQWLSWRLSDFQSNIWKPILWIFCIPIIFNVFRRCGEHTSPYFDIQGGNADWNELLKLKTYFNGFDAILTNAKNDFWAAICLGLISVLIFMSKHAYNRYVNYKW